MSAAETECSWCGSELDHGEDEHYRDRGSGEPICYECHHQEYDFECCRCDEYGDVDDRHALLVVGDAEEVGLDRAGVYLVTGLPYYMDGMIEGSLIKASLKWATPLPPGLDPEGMYYPCGHLCADCQAAVGPTWKWIPIELAWKARALRKSARSLWWRRIELPFKRRFIWKRADR